MDDGNFFDEYIISKLLEDKLKMLSESHPLIRRVIRFLALPYCFFKMIDWKECQISKYQVLRDLLYIFFRLKYFPDNYSLCRLWEKERTQWAYYYGSIYDAYQRSQLRCSVGKKKYEELFEDKDICFKLCEVAKFPLPNQFAYVEPHENYKDVIRSALLDKLTQKVIIKAVDGCGGKGIYVAEKIENEILIHDKQKSIKLDKFTLSAPSVVQEYVEQHELLSQFSSSTNTIRIVTFLSQDKKNVLILGAYIRFGIDHPYIDNICTGGVGVKVNVESGHLNEIGYGFNGLKCKSHPTTDVIFKNFQIPFWPEIVKLAKQIQLDFSFFGLLGHDIAVTPNGPVIIEINAIPDIVALEMLCGPLLKNKSIKTEFGKQNLLINRYQERL